MDERIREESFVALIKHHDQDERNVIRARRTKGCWRYFFERYQGHFLSEEWSTLVVAKLTDDEVEEFYEACRRKIDNRPLSV